jgi:hypothetical protein
VRRIDGQLPLSKTSRDRREGRYLNMLHRAPERLATTLVFIGQIRKTFDFPVWENNRHDDVVFQDLGVYGHVAVSYDRYI